MIASQPIKREPRFRSHARTIVAGTWQQISEDIRPDTWLVVVPNTTTATIQVYPSSGQPNSPDAFGVNAGGAIKLPALNQFLSIYNNGPVDVTVAVYAIIGFEFDYEPLQSVGGVAANVAVSNFPATQGVSFTVQGLVIDRSGTITTGGTSQVLAAANANRKYVFIQNHDPAEALWVNFGVAAIAGQPSLSIPANGGAFVMETLLVDTQQINVIAATTGHAFTAKEA